MKLAIALAAALVALPVGLAAQDARKSSGQSDAGMSHSIIVPDTVKWGTAPPFMPPGVQIAVMLGDPAKKGIFIIRGKMPDRYTILPHWHNAKENVTVLSGTFNVGMGGKLDKSEGQASPLREFFSTAPDVPFRLGDRRDRGRGHGHWSVGFQICRFKG